MEEHGQEEGVMCKSNLWDCETVVWDHVCPFVCSTVFRILPSLLFFTTSLIMVHKGVNNLVLCIVTFMIVSAIIRS